MLQWIKISGLLCIFGFLREIRPSEPFAAEYLTGPWRNVTEDQINRVLYPIATYAYLAQLIVVFLITDLLLYKPLIVTIGITGVIIWTMLLWTTSMESLIAIEFLYGTYMAVEIAYFTYIYAKVDKKYYPLVTSHTRAAMFAGKMVACISAQLLIYFKVMDYRALNYITLAAQIAATLCSFALPKVNRSLYFHRQSLEGIDNPTMSSIETINGNSRNEMTTDVIEKSHAYSPIKLIWTHFRNAYTNMNVLQWSIWYAVALCGYLQVIAYVQLMWREIEMAPKTAWNAAADGCFTALAALFALLAGYIHADRLTSRTSFVILAILTLIEGGMILLVCLTEILYVSYVGYILFGALYGFIITVAGTEVARHLEEESFGLVFGFNTMIALILQTILTAVATAPSLSLSCKHQFIIYSVYFIGIGAIALVAVVCKHLIATFKTKSCK